MHTPQEIRWFLSCIRPQQPFVFPSVIENHQIDQFTEVVCAVGHWSSGQQQQAHPVTVVAENGHHGAEDDSPIGETDKGGGECVADAVGWCGGFGRVLLCMLCILCILVIRRRRRIVSCISRTVRIIVSFVNHKQRVREFTHNRPFKPVHHIGLRHTHEESGRRAMGHGIGPRCVPQQMGDVFGDRFGETVQTGL